MFSILKPAAHIEKLPENEINSAYKKYRIQVFIGIFIGYASYYLVRKNFALAIPDLIKEGFTKAELGFALSGVSIAYGISKFVMGNFSDRSNPRYFMPLGLVLSSITMASLGLISWTTSSISAMFIILFLNGWFQGMGWPPSGRTMVHWFSITERGTKMAFWNIAHNVGGGLIGPLAIAGIAIFSDWHSTFYFPAIIAILIAIITFILLKDTPQSVGLPPIEEFKKDYPEIYDKNQEREFSAKEIFFKHILPNKWLWSIAFANAFVYFVRYGVVDWAPTYLTEVKGFSADDSKWAYFAYEWAGIPGTLICGYLSDKVFKGRRAPAGIIYMILVFIAILIYWLNPAGHPLIDNIALVSIGFLIYGPVMLIGVHALDLVPKKAAGTAAGLTGLFGYFIGASLLGNIAIGYVVDNYGWNGGFFMLALSSLLAIVFLAFTWNQGGVVDKKIVE
ncbi:MAG: glycerol-3-phosphate transporter [Bacteroidales bacterium]|nr:glycerol-3-phosphate transporter [Bacteroidales bacterium]MBN2758528.1 glycerol-3-phosphate transporter [Bacteroidales bacterium]